MRRITLLADPRLSVHLSPILPLPMLTRMVDCVTWNFDNQIVVGKRAARQLQSTFRLQPHALSSISSSSSELSGKSRSLHAQYRQVAGARFHRRTTPMPLCACNVKNGFTSVSLPELRHPDKRSDEQNNNLRHVNLVYECSQRATNRFGSMRRAANSSACLSTL